MTSHVSIKAFVMVLATMLEASGLAGCAGTSEVTTFHSEINLQDPAPIDRILIYLDIAGPGFTSHASAGFQAGVIKRLAACGVGSTVLLADPMELDPAGRLETAMKALQASAVMTITTTGGVVGLGSSGTWSKVFVKLKLLDSRSMKKVWLADSITYLSNEDSGAAFAIRLAMRLRDDGVLKNCLPGEMYPGCLQDRRQVLIEASKLEDPRDRKDAFKSVPHCEVAVGSAGQVGRRHRENQRRGP